MAPYEVILSLSASVCLMVMNAFGAILSFKSTWNLKPSVSEGLNIGQYG